MSTDPEQIRRDIENTRASLSSDVDTLNEKMNPRYAVRRGQSRMRDRMTRMRESVMGATPTHRAQVSGTMGTAQHKASAAASSVGDSASSAASSVGDTASQASDTVVQRTEGNPLAAGLIAFGFGWLASSLVPSSTAERQAGGQLRERGGEVAGSMAQEAKHAAQDTAQQVRQPAEQSAESVRSTAEDAAGRVGDEARSAGQDVKEQTRDSGQTVRRNAGQ